MHNLCCDYINKICKRCSKFMHYQSKVIIEQLCVYRGPNIMYSHAFLSCMIMVTLFHNAKAECRQNSVSCALHLYEAALYTECDVYLRDPYIHILHLSILKSRPHYYKSTLNPCVLNNAYVLHSDCLLQSPIKYMTVSSRAPGVN